MVRPEHGQTTKTCWGLFNPLIGLNNKKYAIGNWSPHNTDTYYKYDDNGNEIEAKGFYITKKDTVLGYHYFYQYNDKGNKIKEDENFGKYRRIGFEKYKTELIEYDNFQNIVLQEFIKSEGQRIKVLKYNYVYDDKGNWIERQKMEGKTSSDLELTERKTREIKYYNWQRERIKTAPNNVYKT